LRVGGLEREAVVVAGDGEIDDALEGLEIADHGAVVEGVGGEHDLDGAAVAVGELARAGVFGEQVAAFDGEGFGDAEGHGGAGANQTDIAWLRSFVAGRSFL
jgi:hypothetical protein